MSDVLKTIIADKTIEVTELKASPDSHSLAAKAADMPPARGFANALRKSSAQGYGLIAEFKRASPSRGLINPDADPANIAQSYEAGGATCLSVLTDQKYFHGHINDMIAAKSATLMPVLQECSRTTSQSKTLRWRETPSPDCAMMLSRRERI